jgi:hypothetical protein
MELVKRIEACNYRKCVSLGDLKQMQPHEVNNASWRNTKYGGSVLLHLQDNTGVQCCVFLPQRYSNAFTAKNIEDIILRHLKLRLIYKGLCDDTKTHRLSVEAV